MCNVQGLVLLSETDSKKHIYFILPEAQILNLIIWYINRILYFFDWLVIFYSSHEVHLTSEVWLVS